MSESRRKEGKRTLYSYDTPEEERLARYVHDTMYRHDALVDHRLASLSDIGEQQVKQYWEKGFLVIENVLNDRSIEQSVEALMDILNGRSVGSKVQWVKPVQELTTEEERELSARKVYNYIDHEPRLKAIAYHEGILQAMGLLLGEQAKVVQDQAILKPPSGGAEKPWHQDMAYGNLSYDKPVIGIWLALDPADLDNGCMHIVPGSHQDGGVPHYAVRDWQLCDRNVRVDRDLAVPLKPGGALIFSGLLHHGTPPNFSAKRRRALQIHYAPESAVKMLPGEYKRMFTNEMTGAEC
ncbi:MAG: phytanoyl-CoA dioxygenase family protein [Paenibacillaceae bacterium]|nr:phytanoyl-CoA dioxygenase family protein [Paenibacillaceae bacterium]